MQLFLSFLSLSSVVFGLPIRREVPQEHSHQKYLTAVRASLNLNNPDNIVDPVFGLLGNAAAAQGAGNITDSDCLQQATADRAFSNAKGAGDVDGQVAALVYRALERNTGKVGLASAPCTIIQAVNPEIAAIQQHQDPASDNAPAVNKNITLELARQITSVGGNPLIALDSGTFAPGDVNDPTAAGNTCDDPNDSEGCIFTQHLLVPDATEEEILTAVGEDLIATNGSTGSADTGNTGIGELEISKDSPGDGDVMGNDDNTGDGGMGNGNDNAGNGNGNAGNNNVNDDAENGNARNDNAGGGNGGNSDVGNDGNGKGNGKGKGNGRGKGKGKGKGKGRGKGKGNDNDKGNGHAGNSNTTAISNAINGTETEDSQHDNGGSADAGNLASAQNLQTFTGALGGATAPAVTAGGRGFIVEGADDFVGIGAALGRSCDIQHNKCADIANSQNGGNSGLTVNLCDQQSNACRSAAQN